MNNNEPKFLEVKEMGDSYIAVPVHIPKPSDDVVRRVDYDSTTQYHVEDCLRKANMIENPEQRKDFVLSELEVMFG